jgi:nanoRNase/pAp phosphatase (c-di-AMP/oligoRNAs hydrolase)
MKMIVLGHQNPDCDSLCSAIALASLFNKLGKEAREFLVSHFSLHKHFRQLDELYEEITDK